MSETWAKLKYVWNYEDPKEQREQPVRSYSSRLDILKWIAIITMIIDHVGYFFFPGEEWFRVVGRIAFPIFAYLIAEGAIRTRSRRKYLIRLWMFALLSQIPYLLAFDNGELNVLFTLYAGLLLIHIGWHYVLLIGLISTVLPLDYGVFGVFLVYGFYLFLRAERASAKSVLVLAILAGLFVYTNAVGWKVQYFGLIGIVMAFLLPEHPWGHYLKTNRWFFYAFYPVHLAVIAIVHITFYR